MPLNAPFLGKKLDMLFQHHKHIHTRKRLANCLNIKPHNISTWCSGNQSKRAGDIPDRHVAKICELFGISTDILQARTLKEFEEQIGNLQQPNMDSWTRLLQHAELNKSLSLVREKVGNKGYSFPETNGDSPLEQYRINENVVIRLDFNDGWINSMNKQTISLTMVHKDQEAVKLICPSKNVPVHILFRDDQTFFIPSKTIDGEQTFLKVSGPSGEQSTYALLSADQQPIAEELGALDFGAHLTNQQLENIALVMAENEARWKLLKYTFEVVY